MLAQWLNSSRWLDINQFTFTIPKNTPSGQYLLRGEQIALHLSGTQGGAQLYLACAQLNVRPLGLCRSQKKTMADTSADHQRWFRQPDPACLLPRRIQG